MMTRVIEVADRRIPPSKREKLLSFIERKPSASFREVLQHLGLPLSVENAFLVKAILTGLV